MGNFYTDVVQKSQDYSSTGRVHTLDLLEPTTRAAVLALIKDAHDQGVELMVYETFRSTVRQRILFERGVTKRKEVGVHLYGLACDIVKSVKGQPSWDGSFDIVGKLAQTHKLIWGGDWGTPGVKHSIVDPVHVQRCAVPKQSDLFSGTWYPDETYNPYV